MTVRQCPCGKRDQLRRGVCHSCYEKARRAGNIEPLVSSRAARAHIVLLCVNGWRYREIARAAGIDRSQVAWIIARGREKITAKTNWRICGIDVADRQSHVQLAWNTRRARPMSYEELQAQWEARHPIEQPVPAPEEWSEAALCAQVDNEIFFPEKGGSTREAKKVCQMCEVREQCLDWALKNDIRYGIFGGLSVRERGRQLSV